LRSKPGTGGGVAACSGCSRLKRSGARSRRAERLNRCAHACVSFDDWTMPRWCAPGPSPGVHTRSGCTLPSWVIRLSATANMAVRLSGAVPRQSTIICTPNAWNCRIHEAAHCWSLWRQRRNGRSDYHRVRVGEGVGGGGNMRDAIELAIPSTLAYSMFDSTIIVARSSG